MDTSSFPTNSMPMQNEPQHQTDDEMPSQPKPADDSHTGKSAADTPVEVHGPPVNEDMHMDDVNDNRTMQHGHDDAEMTPGKATCEPIIQVTHFLWHL